MFAKYKLLIQIGGAVVLIALMFGGGFGVWWNWNGALGDAELAKAKQVYSDTLAEMARAGERQLQRRQALLLAEREKLQALDTKHNEELEDAKQENERLQRLYSGADAERKRLRIEVRVARADDIVSETTGGSSLGDVAALELSGEAGLTVWDIRRGMIEDQAKLRYLQEFVNSKSK